MRRAGQLIFKNFLIMKNKPFETAVETLQTLFAALSERGVLTNIEILQFNISQKNIIAWYNFLEGTECDIKYPWSDQYFMDAWNLWKTYKKQQFRFSYKPISEQSALSRLSELSKGEMSEAIKILKTARDCGWQGFFVEKGKSNSKPKPNQVYAGMKERIANRLTGNL